MSAPANLPLSAPAGDAASTRRALLDLEGVARVLNDQRHALAVRATCDIMEVVTVLARLGADDMPASVLQMVQQRIHVLASGVLCCLDDPTEPLLDIQERVYPDEKPSREQPQ